MTRAPRPLWPRRRLLQLAAGLSLGSAVGAGALAVQLPQGRRWRLAVVPQLTAVEMQRNWSPVAEALERAGVACELVIHNSIAGFEPEFLRGRADLVYLNPYHMVMARQAHGYAPLLRDARALEGVLVVRQDAPYAALADLHGQRISFPAPNALAASLYPRAVLEREHRLRYEPHFTLNHRNAIRQVLVGDSAAAGAIRTTLEMEAPEIRQSLRVIYVTPPLAAHPLAAHPRVPAAVRRRIVDTLLALARDPAQQPLLRAIQMPDPQAADYRRDYAPLTRLGIEQFVITE